MKKVQIRQGVFETNSSSTHSITICTPEQWEQLESENYVGLSEDLIQNYKDYKDSWMDTYSYETTTPGGERIRLFGDYGRDI